MSTYYAYLSSLKQSDVISRDQWNTFVGEEQATDDLLIGSLYPWANILSTSTSPAVYVNKNVASPFIRYYEVSGNFKNSNNPAIIVIEPVTGTYNFFAHQILVPGFYAWNILWGETIASATNDQVITVKVRKKTGGPLSSDPNDTLVIGEHRSLTTSWAQGVNDRYYQPGQANFGMGFPLRSYSGMHFFNAPPYSNAYEYVLFEFSSSNIASLAPNNYFSRMIGPNITFMKVR
jgi:hypothetical protein